jgi:hypothetical protein
MVLSLSLNVCKVFMRSASIMIRLHVPVVAKLADAVRLPCLLLDLEIIQIKALLFSICY